MSNTMSETALINMNILNQKMYITRPNLWIFERGPLPVVAGKEGDTIPFIMWKGKRWGGGLRTWRAG